jgi:hypothetical protein
MSGLFGKSRHNSTAADQLSNMSIQTSGYGRCIPVVYGKARVSANLIFYADFKAIAHTEKQKVGKGGGGSTQKNTTYTYTAAVILGICEGPVGFARVWVDKDSYKSPGAAGLSLTMIDGKPAQAPWSYLVSKHPGKAVGYGSTAYAAHPALDLGASGATKNHSFEIVGYFSGANPEGDANPADVLLDMLTHPVHGMGFPPGSVDGLAGYRLYAQEAGFLVSAAYEDQKQGIEVLKTLLECTNSIAVWSGGKLRIQPLGDLPVGDWHPNSTPLYALTMDDFLSGGPGDDPIKVRRKTSADAYNSVKVKFKNRGEVPPSGEGGTGGGGGGGVGGGGLPIDPLYPEYKEALL